MATKEGEFLDIIDCPGLATSKQVDDFVEDSIKNGLPDGKGGRLAVCIQDVQGQDYAGKSFLAHCSSLLQMHIQDVLKVNKKPQFGAICWQLYIEKCYRPSATKVKDIERKLEQMDLRSYPSEDVTKMNADVAKLMAELKLNVTYAQQCPTLMQSVLAGYAKGTDPYFSNKVTDITLTKVNPRGTPTSAEQILDVEQVVDSLENTYITMKEQKVYGPAKQAPAPDS